MNNKGADQTAQKCRLICTFVVRIIRFSYDMAHISVVKQHCSNFRILRSNLFRCPNFFIYSNSLYISLADPKGVRGGCSNPSLNPNYFIFMKNFKKSWVNWSNRTPLLKANLNPLSNNPGCAPEFILLSACDQIARGPILTKPFPKDQYIDSFGGNITMPCSGYFGCSDDGTTDGDALWLVKENGHYHYAIHVSPRYSVFKYSK